MTIYQIKFIRNIIHVGYLLTALGCLGLLLGLTGLLSFDYFAYGLSSGIRVVGSFAITGCLLGAIGHGLLDYSGK